MRDFFIKSERFVSQLANVKKIKNATCQELLVKKYETYQVFPAASKNTMLFEDIIFSGYYF